MWSPANRRGIVQRKESDVQASRKPVQTKLSREFGSAISAFQRVQKLSAEKQRSYVENQKRRVEELVEDDR